jgi:hypothetical protein
MRMLVLIRNWLRMDAPLPSRVSPGYQIKQLRNGYLWILHLASLDTQNSGMDAVEHPLDWWAFGGYDLVRRELHCAEAEARRRVRLKFRDYHQVTGDPIWQPRGSAGYATLRRAILEGHVLFNDLM